MHRAWVGNDGDAPLYVHNLNIRLYVDNESILATVSGTKVVILPGEEKEITLEIAWKQLETPRAAIRIVIEGDRQDIEKSFVIDLEKYVG